jgi:hypothetical protein
MIKRPKTGQQICKDCFFYVFETEVHNTITEAKLFKPGDMVAIGASGGKGEPSNPKVPGYPIPNQKPKILIGQGF